MTTAGLQVQTGGGGGGGEGRGGGGVEDGRRGGGSDMLTRARTGRLLEMLYRIR